MRKPKYIDIHVHSDSKTFLSADSESERISCVKKMNMPLLLKIIDFAFLGGILGSQASLRQLNRRRGTVAFAGIYAFEKGLLQAGIDLGNGFNLDLPKMADILTLIGHPKTINKALINRIKPDNKSYFEVFGEMKDHLIGPGSNWRHFNLLNSFSDYKKCKLNIVLTIEGGHNLFDTLDPADPGNNFLRNLQTLMSGPYRYFWMNIAHVQNNYLCTHAYGMKLISDPRFFPRGSGITPGGLSVIDQALRAPRPILIDVKHMSLKSRQDYYNFRRNNFPHIPLIMSHGGVTGRSVNNMPVVSCNERVADGLCDVQYYKPSGIGSTHFNPWSINLYDEDITEIINSDGLIGIILDERILGTKQKKASELVESFSLAERNRASFNIPLNPPPLIQEPASQFETLLSDLRNKVADYLRNVTGDMAHFHDYDYQLGDIINLFDDVMYLNGRRISEELIEQNDIKHLCNNILHIIKTGGPQAWDHISIGSDFDGLIDAVEGCNNATRYNRLRCGLLRWLPRMAAMANPAITITDIRQKVYNIMAGNAFGFLRKHFV